MTQTIDFEAMKEKLLPLEHVQERLASTEPLTEVTFPAGGKSLAVAFSDDPEGNPWHQRPGTDPAPVWLRLPGDEMYQLTEEAAEQLGSKCGMPDGYQRKLPPSMATYDLNYWLQTGLGDMELKLLTGGTGKDPEGKDIPLALAVCRPSLVLFSGLKFLDILVKGLRGKYGENAEILADYKFHHDLERTAVRLIVPGYERVITGTSVADDTWSLGLDLFTSLVGLKPSTLQGYQFRWWCTNGATTNLASSGRFSRRGQTEDDAMEWAKKSVDEILDGLEGTFDVVQSLTGHAVEGEVMPVLRGIYRDFGIAKPQRLAITETMADTGGTLTEYDLLSAVTMAANAPGLDDAHVRRLLDAGGHIAGHTSGTCPTCHQFAPDGFESAVEVEGAEGESAVA